MTAFGISINQASANLNRHLGIAPDNMLYHKSVRGNGFKPLFLKRDTDSDLFQLRSISNGIITQEAAWIDARTFARAYRAASNSND